MSIHPLAIVDPSAELDSTVSVGSYSIIEKGVRVDAGTEIGPHAVIGKLTTIGKGNRIGPFTTIGTPPQDITYADEDTLLSIGDHNIIREYCSIHRGTVKGRGETVIGNNNMLMAYCHVAHDCILKNNIVLVNNATLGGHVEVGDRAIIGGMTGIHQFSRIGEYAFVGGMSGISMDVPPYLIVAGIRNDMRVRSINRIGLKRAGFSGDEIRKLGRAYTIIFKTEGLLLQDALEQAESEITDSELVNNLIQFFKDASRNVVRLSKDDE
ncbi:MAG: acyl-ACP--UDP-N-acetylglucosamine O-acyltransferase [Desulfobulbaceae bacterium]|uniref:Acyl-[acyl-carrier-protein]--UDP-N-acetylglucosamine O-acyltransferase n=1 Tax=Candidatus Desulfobia pelagia TaxID=2841692 RepID=A0A8J6NBA4_9BACT|nr:acyl-ACP--UDP-N-acetylglucosamine O-acyltransferase [Candidatus Desulfobia pelagia]